MKKVTENKKRTPRRAKDRCFIDWKRDHYALIGQPLSILILGHCSSPVA